MKKLITTLVIILIGTIGFSQAPQKFTYQSVVRSADGTVLRSSDIGLQISILKNSAIGQSVYSETHSARSNINGLVTVVIGDGVTGDNISDIDWSTGQYYIKVEVDPSGGIGYSIEQTAQLLSVPYALYAGNSSSSSVDLDKDVEGILPVSSGGTGSSTAPMIAVVTAPDASTARAVLGIGSVGGSKVVLKSVTDNYLNIEDKTDGSGDQELTAGTVPITLGGTGSTTAPMVGVITAADAAAARTVLGIDGSGTDNSTPVTLKTVTDNYLTLSGQEITAGTVPLSLGGTGATGATSARTNLGLGTIATQASDAVDIDGGAIDGTKIGETTQATGAFTSVNATTVSAEILQSLGDKDISIKTGSNPSSTITIKNGSNGNISLLPEGTGQVVVGSITMPVADGTTGQVLKTDGSGNLGWVAVDASGTDNSTAVTLATVTDNYLTLSGQEITAGTVPITLGGTGSTTAPMVGVITAADAAAARTSLGLGTIATQASDAVDIDGGAIDGTKIGETTQATGAFTSVNATTVSASIFQSSGDTDVTLKTGNSTSGSISIVDGADGNISISPNGTGQVVIGSITMPSTDGTTGQVLKTDGGGNLGWVATVAAIDNLTDAKKGGTNFTGSMLIGHESVPNLSADAEYNLGIGTGTLDALTEGDKNIAIGYQSMTDNTTGSENTAVGYESLANNVAGAYNTAMGYRALYSDTDHNMNYTSAFGYQALKSFEGALSGNDAFGYNSQQNLISGRRNVAFGGSSLFRNKTGSDNTSIGWESLYGAVDQNHSGNTAIGYKSGYAIETGGDNVFVGKLSGDTTTTGSNNVVVGSTADVSVAAASNQIVIGYGATGGGDNTVVIGNEDTVSILPPGTSSQVDIGNSTKQLKDIYVDGVAYTDALGFGNTAITLPTADGSANQVLKTDGSGTLSWTAMSGANAIDDLTDAKKGGTNFTGSMLIGHESVPNLSADAQYNLGIGTGTLDALTEGDNNVAIGVDALTAVTTQTDNVAIGANALDVNTANYNVAVGSGAGGTNTTGGGSVFLGYNANGGGSGGSKVIAIGMSSAFGNSADEVIAIGDETMYNNSSGTKNIGIGKRAIMYNATGDGNTAVGWQSLIGTSGNNHSNNSAYGYHAGSAIETGGDNVFVGKQSGDTTTTGSQNVVVGSTADVSVAAASNQIVIGYGAIGGGDNTVVIGNEDTVSMLPPGTSGQVDIGSTSKQLKDLYVDGVAYTDALGFGTTAMTLPTTDGTTGQVLKTDGSGNIGWGSAGGGALGDLSDVTNPVEDSFYLGQKPSQYSITDTDSRQNIAIGLFAMRYIDDVDSSIAIGYDAMIGTNGQFTGDENIGIGKSAMRVITSGSDNTAVGVDALVANTSGSNNVSIGNESLSSNTQGGRNTAVGFKAMYLNQTGERNAAFGYASGKSGSQNASFGAYGLTAVTGSNNTALGYYAGASSGSNNAITSGTNNVVIGHNSGVEEADASNRIVIGKGASGLDDNTVTLGNTDITAWVPADDGGVDLGSSTKEMKDIYVDGVAYTDAIGFGTTAFTLPTSAGSDGQILAKASGTNTLEWVNNSGVAGGINQLTDGEISGSDNSSVALGTNMGSGNSKRNTALGAHAMQDYSADDVFGHNTAVGFSALRKLTTGTNNTAVGNEIGAYGGSALTGSHNTILGSQAFLNLTSGSNNTVVGKRASEIVTTGSQNVIVGTQADVNSSNANAQNQIVIGYNADGIGDNKAVIGNTSVTDVYMAQDGEATVHAAGITFSDGTSQTTAAGSGFSHNQVIAASETDTSVELAIGNIKVRIDNGYLQAKGDGQNVSLALFAKIYPGGSAAWNSYGENVWFGAESGYSFSNGTWRDLIEESSRGGEYENHRQDAKLDTYGMIVVEAYEKDYSSPHKNNYYKITAWKGGWGKVYIRGEYFTYPDYSP